MSDSVRPHRREPTRLPCPWDSPGKNTAVGCHFLLQCMKVKSQSEVTQSCPTLATPWTAAYQAPPSMGFSRQKYWSGVPLPSPSVTSMLSQKYLRNYLSVKSWLSSVQSLSRVWLLVTPWIETYQAPPPMGFSRQEYWSRVPLHSPQCRWVWVNSGSWWWTGKPSLLQSLGLQRVGHNWATELNCTDWNSREGTQLHLLTKLD